MTASNHQGSVEGHTGERTGWYFDVDRGGTPVIRNVHEAGCDDIAVIATWTSATHAERLAHARLVAASPELRESLQTVLALARLKYGNLDPDVNAVFAQAEAALSKATPNE